MLGQRVQLGQIGHRLCAVGETERIVTTHPLRTRPVLPRPERLQLRVQTEPAAAPAADCRTPAATAPSARPAARASSSSSSAAPRPPVRQYVDQFVDVLWILREELAVLGHELVEQLRSISGRSCACAASNALRSVSISLIRSTSSGVVLLQRLLHALESRPEQLPAEQLADLLVLLPRLRRLPVVVRQLPYGGRRTGMEARRAEPPGTGRRRTGSGTARAARPRAPRRAAAGRPAGCRRGCAAAGSRGGAPTTCGSGRPGPGCSGCRAGAAPPARTAATTRSSRRGRSRPARRADPPAAPSGSGPSCHGPYDQPSGMRRSCQTP